MSESYQSDIERLNRELDRYRSIAKINKASLEENIWVAKQFIFWVEGTRFLISELEIWERVGNSNKCEETVRKIQHALDHLHELLDQLEE